MQILSKGHGFVKNGPISADIVMMPTPKHRNSKTKCKTKKNHKRKTLQKTLLYLVLLLYFVLIFCVSTILCMCFRDGIIIFSVNTAIFCSIFVYIAVCFPACFFFLELAFFICLHCVYDWSAFNHVLSIYFCWPNLKQTVDNWTVKVGEKVSIKHILNNIFG